MSNNFSCCNLLFRTETVYRMHIMKMHGKIVELEDDTRKIVRRRGTNDIIKKTDNTSREEMNNYCNDEKIKEEASANIGNTHVKTLLKCTCCKYESRQEGDLIKHFKANHFGKYPDLENTKNNDHEIKLEHQEKVSMLTDNMTRDSIKDSLYTCPYCGIKKTTFIYDHIRDVHIRKIIKCTKCNYQHNRKKALSKHFDTYHKHEQDNKGEINWQNVRKSLYTCPYCGIKTKHDVSTHIREKHLGTSTKMHQM